MIDLGRSSSPTLGSLLDDLGALVVGDDVPPERRDNVVRGVVIDDPELGAPFPPGSLVLAVGTSGGARLGSLLQRASAAGAAAVVVRRVPGAVPARAPGHAVPVVEVAPDLAWDQLHLLLRTALEGRTTGPTRPRSLFDVANSIAVLVDGAVVIEDEHLRVVAYSSLDHEIDEARRATILGRQIPDRFVRQIQGAGVTDHLEGSADPLRFDIDGPGYLPRLVVALRFGDRTIGLLWVITDDEREAHATRVLADVAPDVAVDLHRHLTSDSSRATDRRAAARQLLDGRPVANLAELLGTERQTGFVAAAVQPVSPSDAAGVDDLDPVGRVAQFADVYIEAYRLPALVASPTAAWVDLVIALGGPVTAARARAILDQLCDRAATAFHLELRGAMGTVVPDIRSLPASRHDAVAVLEVLADRASGATAAYEEVQSAVALRELVRNLGGSAHLSRGPVPDLLASANVQDQTLVATVESYLRHHGDVARAAHSLDVHRNTVRYRLARFRDVTGVDLDHPTDRLVVQLQLASRAS